MTITNDKNSNFIFFLTFWQIFISTSLQPRQPWEI